MVDVLHYLFEEDVIGLGSPEFVDARDSLRKEVYSTLYDIEYKYGKTSSDQQYIDDSELEHEEPPVPLDPSKQGQNSFGVTKPYRPATSFDENSMLPFGSKLDAPLK